MARPTKNEHEKRSTTLPTIRVTPAERVLIEDKAATAGFTITDFVRTAALFEKVSPRKTKLEASLLVELNRVGVNINQLAHAANVGCNRPALLQTSLDELRQLMAKIDAAI